METMSYILFICVAVPILLMLLPVEKGSRKVLVALLVGMFGCLFISEVNGLLLKLTGTSVIYFTSNGTPITEELVKALPLIFYAAVFSQDKKSLITVAFGIGVGFALLENMIIITQHINTVNIFFALIRGFSSGLMHSICCIMSAYSCSYIHTKRKLFISNTICTLNLAVVYHSVFNLLVEADSNAANYIGYCLPIASYLLLNMFFIMAWKNMKNAEKEQEKEQEKEAEEA